MSRRRRWTAFSIASAWGAAILFALVQSAIIVRVSGGRVRMQPGMLEQVVFLLIWGAATPAILWSAHRLPIHGRKWLAHLAAHVTIALAFILALNVGGIFLTRLLLAPPLDPRDALRRALLGFALEFHLALIAYAFILGIGHFIQALSARRAEELRSERLRADLAEAQLRALQLQLQPHFLFNALNAVGSLILTERHAEAFEVVGQLGDLLRALLANEQRTEVTLRDELDIARAYVAIEQARLGDRLRCTWDTPDELSAAQLPPMLLQPLLENAIRHGIARRAEGGVLQVRASRVGARLRLEICDNGPGNAPDALDANGLSGSGIGLANTRRRLQQLYGAEHTLELERLRETTQVIVELPFHESAASAETAA